MGKEQDLVQAIRTNDVESFRKIISKFKSKTKRATKKISLHVVDHDGFIPLHHAALSGNGEIVMALLEFNTDVNAKDKKGMSPLHLAAWAGKVEPTLLLLDAGAQTNLCSKSGATPLHLASEHGNYGVVERLVDHDCDPTVVNNQGETALDLACRFGHLEVVRILLNNSKGKCEKLLNPKEFQEKASPLHMAAKTGHFDVVRLLVECGADINQRGPTGTCLHEAALYGKTDVCKYLIDAGIDANLKNREGHTALEMVTRFTKSGASSEIKHLLREASIEVVYAKAVKDYANVTDSSSLTLHMGDVVLVLDKRKDGMWKGCIRDDQKERVGFFPASCVQFLRTPQRNSISRSLSSSSETSRISTSGTVSNTFEIVTVSSPTQPAAGKSRAPRMTSFRKKAANNDESSNVNNVNRLQSEHNADNDQKKKLNYVDIVVVDNPNKKPSVSLPASKTDYADVWCPNTNKGDNGVAMDNVGKSADNVNGPQTANVVQRTNNSGKSVRVNGSYARLGHQVFGKNNEEQEKLNRALLNQQEQRLKRLQHSKDNGNHHGIHEVDEGCQGDLGNENKHDVQTLENNVAEIVRTFEQDAKIELKSGPLSPASNLPNSPSKSRQHTTPSVDTTSENDRSSPSKDKKLSSLRAEKKIILPPPPPPSPPVESNPSSPTPSGDVTTPRGTTPKSPTVPAPLIRDPKTVLSPSSINKSFNFSKKPVPLPTSRTSTDIFPPPMELLVNQPQAQNEEVRSTSPPLPPPPPPPPPPPCLNTTSSSDVNELPPPPQFMIENSSNEDVTVHPTTTLSVTIHPTTTQSFTTLSATTPTTTPCKETSTKSGLHIPSISRSRSGYEDMTMSRRTNGIDGKGYVMVNPVKRPDTPPTNESPPSQPYSFYSPVYENFTPLKTRNLEMRGVGHVHKLEKSTSSGELDELEIGESRKPEKPTRHPYENFEVGNSKTGEIVQNESTSGVVPVLRVSPVPQQVTSGLPSNETNDFKMREYNELYDWLAQSKLLTYMENFAEAGFDLSSMAGVTTEDLSAILINKTGHRKRLLSEAAKLSTSTATFENNVPSWLQSLGLSRYEGQFIDSGFDDLEFLYDITKEDLDAIGVTKIGHQRKILMAAKKLQQRGTPWEPVV